MGSESKGGENATKDDEKKSDDKATDKDTKTKKRPPKKRKKFITVQKEKKRVHKKALTVKTYHVGRIQPYSESTLEESKAKLALLAAKDKALQELEEMKNKLESYIYYIKNKLSDKAKYDSLYEPADGTLFFRLKEATDRPAAILAM